MSLLTPRYSARLRLSGPARPLPSWSGEGAGGHERSDKVELSLIKETAQEIFQSSKTVALTGAGISAESGIPTFRGSQSLWSKYDPAEFADVEAFLRNPGKVWQMIKELIL